MSPSEFDDEVIFHTVILIYRPYQNSQNADLHSLDMILYVMMVGILESFLLFNNIGMKFVLRLLKQKVDVKAIEYKGLMHAFMNHDVSPFKFFIYLNMHFL